MTFLFSASVVILFGSVAVLGQVILRFHREVAALKAESKRFSEYTIDCLDEHAAVINKNARALNRNAAALKSIRSEVYFDPAALEPAIA